MQRDAMKTQVLPPKKRRIAECGIVISENNPLRLILKAAQYHVREWALVLR